MTTIIAWIEHVLAAVGFLFLAAISWAAWPHDGWGKVGYAKPVAYGIPLLSRSWRPSSNQGLEPYGGNLYRRHVYRDLTGQLWQCHHGWTCGNSKHEEPTWAKKPRWMICWRCAGNDPVAYLRWRYENTLKKIPLAA